MRKKEKKPVEVPQPFTPLEQRLLEFLALHEPWRSGIPAEDRERVVRRFCAAYTPPGAAWILGEVKKATAWLADHGEREGKMRDWVAFLRKWLTRAYGDPLQRQQIQQLTDQIGKKV